MTSIGHDGLPSYQGYEFQKIITVWVGLKLLIEQAHCTSMIVEPASAEDIAVDLKVPEADSRLGVVVGAIPLEIQIKSRSSGWNAASFGEIVCTKPRGARGPAPRARALQVLAAKPDQLYTLITNAQLDANLADYRIEQLGKRSAATQLECAAGKGVPAAVLARVGILAEVTVERAELEIADLLKRCGHVPHARVPMCRDQLVEAIHLRLLGKAGKAWKLEELESVFRTAGAPPRTASSFVPPTVFPELERQLDKNHRLLLTGVPGLGKTSVARELVRCLQSQPEPFELVLASAGAEGIRKALAAPGPHVFFFDDPWGSERLAADAAYWTGELPKLLGDASASKRFIISSRDGIRHEALGSFKHTGLTDGEFQLTPAHYPEELRWQIVQLRWLELAPWQRDWLTRHRARCLADLVVPLSLDHLVSRVKRAAKSEELDLDEVIRECGVDALASTCANEIRARGNDTTAASLVLWALHQADGDVTQASARAARKLVRTSVGNAAIDPERTLIWLVHAGWFRVSGNGFIAHPTALTGMASFLKSEPGLADDVIQALLVGLVGENRIGAAFRILRHLDQRPSAVTQDVRRKIERHLVQDFLTATSPASSKAMSNIVRYSTADDPVTTLLKILEELRPMPEQFTGFERWKAPTLSPKQAAVLRGSSEAHQAAGLFVLYVLPETSPFKYEAGELVQFFRRLGWDFGPQFQTLSHDHLAGHYTHPDLELFIGGAVLSNNPPFESLLTGIFEAMARAEKEWDRNAAEYRAGNQGEYDAAQASHMDDEQQEQMAMRFAVLKNFVALRRKVEGWRWIEGHPRQEDLLPAWAKVVTPHATDDEIQALIRLCGRAHRDLAWEAMARTGDARWEKILLQDLVVVPVDELGGCVEQLAVLVPLRKWPRIVRAIAALPWERRATLAKAQLFSADDAEAKRHALLTACSATEQSALTMTKELDPYGPVPAKDAAIQPLLLTLAEKAPEHLAASAAVALALWGESGAPTLPHLLGSEDASTRMWATIAAIRCQPPVYDRPQILAALHDPDYHVRRVALLELARVGDAEAREQVVRCSTDASAPIREICARLIGEHGWTEAQDTLLRLAADRRDKNPSPGGNPGSANFHVARAAIKAMRRLGPLATATVTGLLELLRKRSDNDDLELQSDLVLCMAEQDDERVVPASLALLDDAGHVAGQSSDGYPLRYAGAWALLIHAQNFPERAGLIDAGKLVEGAKHDDGRLAGPCLILLAWSAEDSPELLLNVCTAPTITLERAALAYCCLDDNAAVARATLLKVIGRDHPAVRLLDAPSGSLPANEQDWAAWVAAQPGLDAWLSTLRPTKDVFPLLRYTLSTRFSGFVPEALSSDDLAGSLVPKPISVLTTWSMFHE